MNSAWKRVLVLCRRARQRVTGVPARRVGTLRDDLRRSDWEGMGGMAVGGQSRSSFDPAAVTPADPAAREGSAGAERGAG